MNRFLAVAALAASCAGYGADYGPPIGSPMPLFEARDQNGRTRTLHDILGPNGAVLVFFRSADW